MIGCLPVKKLTLIPSGVPLDQQLWFMMLCAPTLGDLSWYTMPKPNLAATFFAQAIKDGHFPRLTRLAMRYPTPNDQSLAKVVEARHPIGFQKLDCRSSAVGPLTWTALRSSSIHLNSLQILLLKFSITTGPMILEMLQSLPNLREFSAGYLQDTDVTQDEISSRPWVCHHLESWMLPLSSMEAKRATPCFLT